MSQAVPPPFPSDEHNPYAPPRADFDLDQRRLAAKLGDVEFSLGDVWSRTWEIYRDRTGFCIGVIVGCWAINVGAQLGISMVQQIGVLVAKRDASVLAAAFLALGNVANFLFQTWITLGQMGVMLDVGRGRETSFGNVFSGGPYLLRVCLGYFLVSLAAAAVAGICLLPGGVVLMSAGTDGTAGWIVLGIGILILVVILVVASLRLSQFVYLIIDRDAGLFEAFQLSNQISSGKEAWIFVVGLIATAMILAGGLAFCVGLIYTYPFTVLFSAMTYLALTGQTARNPYMKAEPLDYLEPL